MPRELSALLTSQKNQVVSTDPFVWLLEVDSPDFPTQIRLVNDVQPLTYQGLVYLPFPFDLSAVQENSLAEKQSLTITVANVDRSVTSLLNTYWDAVVDPNWTLRLWQVLRSAPDELPASTAEVFEILSVETDLLMASFEMQALGIPSRQRSTGRRYTTSSGFSYIPRVGRLFA
jgi:Domain of unknown function (DUF1833)